MAAVWHGGAMAMARPRPHAPARAAPGTRPPAHPPTLDAAGTKDWWPEEVRRTNLDVKDAHSHQNDW